MKFDRCAYPKDIAFEPSTRRVSAAKRAIERLKQKNGLFQTKESLETTNERLLRLHQENIAYCKRMRRFRAEQINDIRSLVRKLKRDGKQGLIDQFFQGGWPKDPTYFLDFMHSRYTSR